jgi:hypothetical protein
MNPAEFQANNQYGTFGMTVADAPVDARRTFIRKTYTHLAAAVYAFVAISWLFYEIGLGNWMWGVMGQGQWTWLIILGGFVAVSWIADSWARSSTSLAMQYAGLFLYVAAESVIFAPLLAFAAGQTITFQGLGTMQIIPAAAGTTLLLFGVMTAVAFLTKQDFSFLGSLLRIAMISAVILIVFSLFTDFKYWDLVRLADGRRSLRIYPVLHVERDSSLSNRSVRGRVAGLVCLGGAAAVVRYPDLFVEARLGASRLERR